MTTLRQGDRGPAVLELQTLLAMTGHDPGPLDGVFGLKTKLAFVAACKSGIGNSVPVADDAKTSALRALPRRAVELPRVLTPVTAVDMRIALLAGYDSIMDPVVLPSTHTRMINAVRVALAQLCVEHGCLAWSPQAEQELWRDGHPVRPHLAPPQGQPAFVYVWNNNIGNRQVRREDREDSYFPMGPPTIPWFAMAPVEGSGTLAHRATSAHYAYPNAAEGAAAYWRFLRDQCKPALAAFEAGDPAAAAHELKVGAWRYSGDEAAYTKAMVDRFRGIE